MPDEQKTEPWNRPNLHGEDPGGACCQYAAGGLCWEHDPRKYETTVTAKESYPLSKSVAQIAIAFVATFVLGALARGLWEVFWFGWGMW